MTNGPLQHEPDADTMLEVRENGGKANRHALRPTGTILGRSDQATIQLPCESVSRRHAEIFRDASGRWWVRDLGSVNGTWMRGRQVEEELIHPGEPIQIGGFSLVLEGRAEEVAAPPSPGPSRERPMTIAIPVRTSELSGSTIATLGEVAAPKIATTHLASINDFANRISQIQDEHERLGELCRLMVRRPFQASCAVAVRLHRAEPDRPADVLYEPQSRVGAPEQLPYLSRGLLRVVCETDSPALAAQTSTDPGAVKMTMISAHQDMAAIACPFRKTPETIDVLYITLPGAYGTGEWLTLIAHAAQTFTHLENALKVQRELEAKATMERDLDRAKDIQEGLVPRHITVPGLEIAIGFEPCRWVAGDYVDVVPTADGRTVLAIADVCGKGLPAALVSATIHTAVQMCQWQGVDLQNMVRGLNEHLCRHLEDCSFVTMVCMIIDPATGKYELVNAGHPAPITVSPDGTITEMQNAAHFPLGIMPFEVETERGVLESGHLLSLFTDGLTELTDENNEEVGPDRIAEHIRDLYAIESAAPGLGEVSSGLTRVLDGYQGDGQPMDDRTFLLVRRP